MKKAAPLRQNLRRLHQLKRHKLRLVERQRLQYQVLIQPEINP